MNTTAMNIDIITEDQAIERIEKHGFWVPMLMTCSSIGKKGQLIVADYRKLSAFTVKFAISINDVDGNMVDRFNVMK